MPKNGEVVNLAVEIARSLAEIDKKVKSLNKTLRESSNETRELDKALRLDSKNTEAVAQKMSTLQTAVGTAAQKVALLKQKQDEANRAFKSGDMTAAEYKKIELSVIRAENELRSLNNEIAKTQKAKLDQTTAGFDKLTAGLNKAQVTAQKLSSATLKIVAALGATVTAFVTVGDELDDVRTKFSITAEHLQTQRFIYNRATDDARNYDKALTKLNSVARQSRFLGKIQEHADEYNDRLAAALEVAEINGYIITFKFKNSAEITRTFNNDTDRKETWNKKLGRVL